MTNEKKNMTMKWDRRGDHGTRNMTSVKAASKTRTTWNEKQTPLKSR